MARFVRRPFFVFSVYVDLQLELFHEYLQERIGRFRIALMHARRQAHGSCYGCVSWKAARVSRFGGSTGVRLP